MSWQLAALQALPWLGAMLLALLPSGQRRTAAWIAIGVAAAVSLLTLQMAPAVFSGEVVRWRVEWLPALQLALSFRVDGLAWLFLLLIGGIGLLVMVYAAGYLPAEDEAPRFFACLLAFMGAMLGVVASSHLLLLAIYWELTGLCSFLLIGFWRHRADARQGARMALAITGMGGLALLGGVLLIGRIVGSFELDVVLAAREPLQAHALFPLALGLVLLGALTKSAQFPFHFWLPHAMAAPTPVSAYLHSATMVKAGVFLLARLYPLLGGNEIWFWVLTTAGLATLLIGAYGAMFQHDLKGLLAYSTISHLGLITLLLGLDEPLAVVAGVFHLINHATFKAGLFMSAGAIDHATGTRDMRQLAGLMRWMPVTATLGMVAAAAMAGVPLLNGFLSKELFFAETLAKESHAVMEWLLPLGALVAAVFGVAYSMRFIHDVFFNGQAADLPTQPHEAPLSMLIPIGLLVLLCVAVGVAPQLMVGPLLAVSAQAALGAPLPSYTLALWHGFNLPLLMSAVAVLGGVALYFGMQRGRWLHGLTRVPGWWGAGKPRFEAALRSLVAGAQALSHRLDGMGLQSMLGLLVLMALAAGVTPFLRSDLPPIDLALPHWQGLSPVMLGLGLLGMACTLATVRFHARRLLALVLVGAVGLVVCLCFVAFSAPDLALTQLLVEVVGIVLMMLALHHLPAESPREWRPWRALAHAALAIGVGLGVSLLVWAVLTRPGASISDYFLANALPLGGGANVVNVIIVDYRSFDTLGEIAVLAVAALLLQALLTPMRANLPPRAGPSSHLLMLQLVARLVLPFTLLIAAFFYLRGHNLPGGGFIAGLVMAIGVLLQVIAHGQHWTEARMSLDFRPWVGWGLLLAVLTGVGSWLFGAPFLTSTFDYPWLPGVGGVPLASAALFDAGVFMVVLGATLVMLLAFARLARRTS